MGDYPYDGNDPKRRRRRRRYEDDAWGMADDADRYDGNEADIEDWAAGLVDEEGRHGRYDIENESAQYGSSLPPRGHHYTPRDPNEPSPAVERATELMDRLNRRKVEALPAQQLHYDQRTNRYRPTSSPCSVDTTLLFTIMAICIVACSCIALVLYTLFG